MARRGRRAAWGSITEVERGRRYRIRYWAKTESGYKRVSETVRGTRKDAERRRSELMLDHSEDAPCPTIGQAWERWVLPDLRRLAEDGDIAPLTVRSHETAWRLHVAPRWADVQLDAARPLQIQQWIGGLSYSQAQTGTSTLSRIMDYAVRYEVVDHNPMRERYVMPSRSTVTRADKGVWSLAELGPLWDSVRGEWWEPAFLLAAYGGCRLGESMAPLAGDVEARDVGGVPVAVVQISGQVAPSGTDVVPPKTPQSVRPVVLAGPPAERVVEIASGLPADWPLTNDGMGGHQRQSRMKEAWRRRKMAHPFRNLRNGWQTWMRWELRVEPYFVETLMGHVGAGVTGRHYDRPSVDNLVSVVAEAWRGRA